MKRRGNTDVSKRHKSQVLKSRATMMYSKAEITGSNKEGKYILRYTSENLRFWGGMAVLMYTKKRFFLNLTIIKNLTLLHGIIFAMQCATAPMTAPLFRYCVAWMLVEEDPN